MQIKFIWRLEMVRRVACNDYLYKQHSQAHLLVILAFPCRLGLLGRICSLGMKPWLFSLVMNTASGLATAIVTAIILLIAYRTSPEVFVPKDDYLNRTA